MKIKTIKLTFITLSLSLLSISQEITLYEQFNWRYDFIAIGNTLNLIENGAFSDCNILTESDSSLELQTNQTLEAAYLYWAGSGSGDFSVRLNSIEVSAERTFSFTYQSKIFFGGFKNVTEIVQTNMNGNYLLSDLEQIDISEDYCSTGTNFAGWTLLVIYKDDNVQLNQLNVYDGLQAVPQDISIELDNINVINNQGAKIGFIAWEGDSSLAVNETLKMNGTLLSNPPLNPETNAFNGTNSFTGKTDLFNMDIDVYDIQNSVNSGDTSALIQLTSGQDLVMVSGDILHQTIPQNLDKVWLITQSFD